ncbi:MAG: iron ABC transporter permease, partial [Spirochaetia bacterium]|nr:iron ABC transporter permease [Spirochaetia bacterium]
MNTKNRFKTFIKKPHNIILVSLAFILIYLTVIPMITIILDTFTVHQAELMRVKGSQVGDFTLYHWTKVLFSSASRKIFYEPFLNTIYVAFGTCF